MDFKDKKVAVLGLGLEGKSVVEFLLGKGASITVLDEKKKEKDIVGLGELKDKGIKFIFGKFSGLNKYDIIFRSPDIVLHSEEIMKAKERGVEISSSTKLFFQLCTGKVIGVTGTKGKGTTATLIYEMLKAQGIHVFLGGNIGVVPLSFLPDITSDSYVVLELSSFQLEDLEVSPHIAVILMITSEHLDHHRDTLEYIDAKRNIVKYQVPGDFAIINKDYPASNESDVFVDGETYQISREFPVEQGCYVKEGYIVTKLDNIEDRIIATKDIFIPGGHNFENACAATMAATIVGVDKDNIAKVLKTFRGLTHRLELVAEIKGVKYYDDSFSTIPESVIAAIEAFSTPEILILGGSSKNSDFTELAETIRKTPNIKAIIGIGKEWERMKSEFRIVANLNISIIEDCKNMKEIVEAAAKVAVLGDVVLLSPACASFDMFKNYKHRGEEFKKEVLSLRN